MDIPYYLDVGPRDVLVHVVLQEDDEERRDEIVDALDVAAGGVPDGPDVEDTLNHLLWEGRSPDLGLLGFVLIKNPTGNGESACHAEECIHVQKVLTNA
jgi:hypothetical protein